MMGSIRCGVAAILTSVCLIGCGLEDRIEGCGDEADALAAEGLKHSAGADFEIAGLTIPLPRGYMYRIRGEVLNLFEAPGIYCDSGDWGILQNGYVRLQAHRSLAPADAFRDFPDTHRGYMRKQIDYPPASPLDYSFTHNTLTWHVRAYFSGVYEPHVRFMYFRTEIAIDGEPVGLSMHYFPHGERQGMYEVSAAIDRVLREGGLPAGLTSGAAAEGRPAERPSSRSSE